MKNETKRKAFQNLFLDLRSDILGLHFDACKEQHCVDKGPREIRDVISFGGLQTHHMEHNIIRKDL